jgi:hypothetical protein
MRGRRKKGKGRSESPVKRTAQRWLRAKFRRFEEDEHFLWANAGFAGDSALRHRRIFGYIRALSGRGEALAFAAILDVPGAGQGAFSPAMLHSKKRG